MVTNGVRSPWRTLRLDSFFQCLCKARGIREATDVGIHLRPYDNLLSQMGSQSSMDRMVHFLIYLQAPSNIEHLWLSCLLLFSLCAILVLEDFTRYLRQDMHHRSLCVFFFPSTCFWFGKEIYGGIVTSNLKNYVEYVLPLS